MAMCSSKEAPDMGNAGVDWHVGGMQPLCGRETLAGRPKHAERQRLTGGPMQRKFQEFF
jgi:hypothetical protein